MKHLSKKWKRNLIRVNGKNKVSSLRDFPVVACRKLKHTVNKVSSLRDFLTADIFLPTCRPCGTFPIVAAFRKLKHTVNKVSSLRDFLTADIFLPTCRPCGTFPIVVAFRMLKHTVNKVSSLRDFPVVPAFHHVNHVNLRLKSAAFPLNILTINHG
jgi:hypothetical protein